MGQDRNILILSGICYDGDSDAIICLNTLDLVEFSIYFMTFYQVPHSHEVPRR